MLTPPRRITPLLITFVSLAFAQQSPTSAPRELFLALNHEREANSLPALKWNDALAEAALHHAKVMAEHDAISHQLPGEPNLIARAKAGGVHFVWLSENVDAGENAAAIHEGFMKSAQHRANILDVDMDSVGIGVAEKKGQLYVTEDFAKITK